MSKLYLKVDVFEIAAADLLDVRKVIAGHNGKAKGQGWFLEKVVIRVTQDDEERSYDFPCNRWLCHVCHLLAGFSVLTILLMSLLINAL